jgi:hypothetical protein
MRRLIVLISGMSIAGAAWALPANCVTGTYASYLALGSTGCQNGNATFSNFGTLGFLNSPGVPQVAAEDIRVIPGGTLLLPTLTFVYLNAAGAPTPVAVNQNGQIFSFGFNYQLALTGANLVGIQMGETFSNTNPGSASATKNAQLLGGIGPIFTSTVNDGGLSNPLGTVNGALTPVSGTGVWVINDTTSLQAQNGGSVTQASFVNLFSLQPSAVTVPEPMTALLIGSGLLCVGLVSRRRRGSNG